MYTADVQGFLKFVQASPSAFHAVAAAAKLLEEKGFAPLKERDSWQLVPGGKYYVTRNLSSLIAFTVPTGGQGPFRIVASHSDSPVFKLKPQAESPAAEKYLRLNVERYGGMIMSTWLDRPLSIAGRVLVRDGERIVTKLVDLGRDAVLIPNQPIHFCRDINDGFKFNPQVDLLPIYGDAEDKGALMREVAAACGADAEKIVGSDLFLYTRIPGTVWGAKGQFFSSPRIDDLECAYTSLVAFADAPVGEAHVNVYALFDNEEVGSRTKQGAASTFLRDVMTRTAAALGADESAAQGLISRSFMVSADNAHAVHPNHPEKFDAENRTFMNGGVVVKSNANQAYTTDGVSQAIFAEICAKANVPVQYFANRSDVPGGSTLGNIANTQVSMNTVDIGLAQLAMHSSYETAGVSDIPHMIRALAAYYAARLDVMTDGEYELV